MNKDIDQWRNQGFMVLKNIINNDTLIDSKNYINNLYNNNNLSTKDFGSEGKLEFPTNTILDQITLNPKIIDIVKILLETDDILLAQSVAWGKEGLDSNNKENLDSNNNDQRMHMDYGNNTFLNPPEWENPEAVAMILYLSDIKETLGGTSCVPRNEDTIKLYQPPYINMPGINNLPFINDKNSAETYFENNNPEIYNFRKKLYENEVILKPDFGDILFYRLDLWHRGTPVKKGKVRFVINLLYKKKEAYWINIWNPGWTKKMYYGEIEKLIISLTPEQRAVLGIPKPGDKYWTLKKIQQFESRYPKIDIEPYLFGLSKL